MAKAFIAALVGCVILIVVFQFIDPSNQDIRIVGDYITSVDGTSLSVSILGEITRSGTYIVEAGSTLSDLIEVASNVTSNADPLAYDTSYVLADGMSFYIAPKYDNTDVCSLEPIIKANINEDSAEDLQKVNGIGATIANAIVNYRSSNGNYGRIEDIKNVTGIGNATFEKVKNYLVLRSA